jgi:hypothetical protein
MQKANGKIERRRARGEGETGVWRPASSHLPFDLCLLPFDLFLQANRASQKSKCKRQMAKLKDGEPGAKGAWKPSCLHLPFDLCLLPFDLFFQANRASQKSKVKRQMAKLKDGEPGVREGRDCGNRLLYICLLTFAFCHLTCSFSPTEQVKSQNAKGKWQN